MSAPAIEYVPGNVVAELPVNDPSVGLAVSTNDAEILSRVIHLGPDEFAEWLAATETFALEGRHLDGARDDAHESIGILAAAVTDEERALAVAESVVAEPERPLTRRQRVGKFIADAMGEVRNEASFYAEFVIPTAKRRKAAQFVTDTASKARGYINDVVDAIAPTEEWDGDFRRMVYVKGPSAPFRETRPAAPITRRATLYTAADLAACMSDLPVGACSALPLSLLEEAFADFAFEGGRVNPVDVVPLRNALDDTLFDYVATGRLPGVVDGLSTAVHRARWWQENMPPRPVSVARRASDAVTGWASRARPHMHTARHARPHAARHAAPRSTSVPRPSPATDVN